MHTYNKPHSPLQLLQTSLASFHGSGNNQAHQQQYRTSLGQWWNQAVINIRVVRNNEKVQKFEVKSTDLVNPQIRETLTLETEFKNVLTSRTNDATEDSSLSQLGIAAVGGHAQTTTIDTAAAPAGRPWQSTRRKIEREHGRSDRSTT
jgi:hypothetical protein